MDSSTGFSCIGFFWLHSGVVLMGVAECEVEVFGDVTATIMRLLLQKKFQF